MYRPLIVTVIVVSGRIKAVQLEYTEAHKNLLQAIRKAPQHTAVGFKQTVSVLRKNSSLQELKKTCRI